jgi:competence protein ComEA
MVESSTVVRVETEPGVEPRRERQEDRRPQSTNGNGHAPPHDVTAPKPATTQSLPPARSFFGLTRADHLVLALLAAVALSLMIWHWARLSGWGMRPVEFERLDAASLDYRIDINTATWVEWVQLDGIGETLAERIVADREAHGPFRSVDDLRRVNGIGPKTLARIRKYLTVGNPKEASKARRGG